MHVRVVVVLSLPTAADTQAISTLPVHNLKNEVPPPLSPPNIRCEPNVLTTSIPTQWTFSMHPGSDPHVLLGWEYVVTKLATVS